MPHRAALPALLVVSAALAVALWPRPPRPTPPPDRPDVVLIVADDLGYGDVGYNGSGTATPAIDRLAAEGVVLDRFYTAARCSPSRAGLLTGRYPVPMGIVRAVGRADTVGLPAAAETLAERLRADGYATAMVGKWHLGTGCAHHPARHGFESFVGMASSGANYLTRSGRSGHDWWRGYAADRPRGYTTDLIADEALEVLAEPRARPLFLYLPFTAPHRPLQAPDADLARYPDLPEPERTYAAMVTALDRAVGRVADAVRASGRPTVVWVVSDNGGMVRNGADNGPLRGGKGDALEGGIRVPGLVWGAGLAPRRLRHPVWYLDVLPTTLALVGAPPAADVDGADQSAQLAGAPPTPALLDRPLYTYTTAGPAQDRRWLAAQTASWKWLSPPDSSGAPGALFRIDDDPGETRDRRAAHPEVAAALREGAEAFAATAPPWATNDLSLRAVRPADYPACAGAR